MNVCGFLSNIYIFTQTPSHRDQMCYTEENDSPVQTIKKRNHANPGPELQKTI